MIDTYADDNIINVAGVRALREYNRLRDAGYPVTAARMAAKAVYRETVMEMRYGNDEGAILDHIGPYNH